MPEPDKWNAKKESLSDVEADVQLMGKPKAMIGEVPVWCAHDEIVACAELRPNAKNPNKHPSKQIKLLGEIILKQGWRAGITVSRRSGLIVRGHGRLAAAVRVGIAKAPVDYQDYESDEAEIADLIADNKIAEFAEIDGIEIDNLLKGLNASEMLLTGYSLDKTSENIELDDIEFRDDKENKGSVSIVFFESDRDSIIGRIRDLTKEYNGCNYYL